MTRGQKGCYIYCTNKGLSDYFKLIYKHQLSYIYEQSTVSKSDQLVADIPMSDIDIREIKPHKI